MNIVINGVQVNGNYSKEPEIKVLVDGVIVWSGKDPIQVTLNGNCKSIETTAGSVGVTGNCDSVKTVSGDVEVYGYVGGNVQTVSGDVRSKQINGSVKTISGDISR